MKLEIGTEKWPLSPSALVLWMSDRRGFLERYLAKSGFVQTLPMAVGSAFDSLIKSHLLGVDVEWQGIELKEDVSAAHIGGYECMHVYRADGLDDLMRLIGRSTIDVELLS